MAFEPPSPDTLVEDEPPKFVPPPVESAVEEPVQAAPTLSGIPNLIALRTGKFVPQESMPTPPASLLYNLGIERPFGQQEGAVAQVGAAVGNLPVDIANFALSPAGLATAGTLPALSPLLQKIVGTAFAAQGTAQAITGKTIQEKTGGILQAGLVGAATLTGTIGRIFGETPKPEPPLAAEIAANEPKAAGAKFRFHALDAMGNDVIRESNLGTPNEVISQARAEGLYPVEVVKGGEKLQFETEGAGEVPQGKTGGETLGKTNEPAPSDAELQKVQGSVDTAVTQAVPEVVRAEAPTPQEEVTPQGQATPLTLQQIRVMPTVEAVKMATELVGEDALRATVKSTAEHYVRNDIPYPIDTPEGQAGLMDMAARDVLRQQAQKEGDATSTIQLETQSLKTPLKVEGAATFKPKAAPVSSEGQGPTALDIQKTTQGGEESAISQPQATPTVRSVLNAERPQEVTGQVPTDEGSTGVPTRGQGEKVQEVAAVPPGQLTFTTAKGSTYQLHEDGTTTRTKAARAEHPGDEGLKARSEKTVFVGPKDTQKLALPKGHRRIIDHGNGTISVATERPDGSWGIAPSQRNIKVSDTPSVGSTPLELWQKGETQGSISYGSAHFGNEITELKSSPVSSAEQAPSALGKQESVLPNKEVSIKAKTPEGTDLEVKMKAPEAERMLTRRKNNLQALIDCLG